MRGFSVLFGLGALAAVTLGTASPGVAAEASGRVCTVGGIAVPTGQPLPEEIPLVLSCFDTTEEAMTFIELGAPGDVERLLGVAHESGRSAVPQSTVTVGKAWKGTSRGGDQLIHWGAGTGCYGVTYGFPTLPSSWDNAIRSSEGFNNCWVTHYPNASYGGPTVNCVPYCPTLAATTSSIVYRPVGTYG